MSEERIKQELWKLYVQFLEEAKKKLERDGNLAPVIFGLTSTGRVIAISTEEETFAEYTEIGEMLRRQHNIVGAVLFEESWFFKSKNAESKSHPSCNGFQNIPMRKKVIKAILVTFGWSEGYILPFHRKGKKVVWEDDPIKLEEQLTDVLGFFRGIH